MGGSVPDERQSRVIEALENRSTRLAGTYKTALDMVASEPRPGCESARISVICHCMRELMLGLPDVMSDSDSTVRRPDKSSASWLKELPGLLANHPDTDLTLDQDLVPVPRAVARALSSLIGAATQEEGRNRANTAALLTGGSDANHPVIKQWMDAYQFFVGWAHLDRDHERERSLPNDQKLAENMKVVEDVIEVRTALFFANLHALHDLLDEINDLGEDSE